MTDLRDTIYSLRPGLGIHDASYFGRVRRVRKIITTAPEQIAERDSHGDTALFKAVTMGRLEITTMLLDAGADPNAKNDEGMAPLFRAAAYGHPELELFGNPEIAQLLISRGADVNTRDNNGVTALHCCHSEQVAEVLINAGADVNAITDFGHSPLDGAIINNLDPVADVLKSHGAHTKSQIVEQEGRVESRKLDPTP